MLSARYPEVSFPINKPSVKKENIKYINRNFNLPEQVLMQESYSISNGSPAHIHNTNLRNQSLPLYLPSLPSAPVLIWIAVIQSQLCRAVQNKLYPDMFSSHLKHLSVTIPKSPCPQSGSGSRRIRIISRSIRKFD